MSYALILIAFFCGGEIFDEMEPGRGRWAVVEILILESLRKVLMLGGGWWVSGRVCVQVYLQGGGCVQPS